MSAERSPAPATEVAPGTIVAERYRIERILGEGGMGIVYLAEHVHMRKQVAFKVLLPAWTNTPGVLARFEREAVAAGAIEHPNVARATDFGRLGDGSFFLVLEYAEGRTLRSALQDGALEPARALSIARGIARGIAAAHGNGILHRDLKPENVMLVTRDGDPDFVKVLDFGVARIADTEERPSGPALTSAGAVVGTLDYMAPEQALGMPVDARSDLYALGVILFELLTGVSPFPGGGINALRERVLAPAPALPSAIAERVPPQVPALIARLLERESAARYADARDLLPALEECIAAMTSAPKPLATPHPAPVLDQMGQRVRVSTARMLGALTTAWHRRERMRAAARDAMDRALHSANALRTRTTIALRRVLATSRGRRDAAIIVAVLPAVVIVCLTLGASSKGTSPNAPAVALNVVTPGLPPPPRVTPSADKEDSPLALLNGTFAGRVESGRPMGDAQEIAAARKVFYWLEFANSGKSTDVVLVWKMDGKEVQRQSLSVGYSPHWRTWGSHAVASAHEIDVQVLDAAGRLLKEDSIALAD